ncbi:MAG: endolytic transglycosylase MltG [Desulforegulaceae bacterium]|nr:endolytic transglycosylase MltG [Desulforegulaceae bacterium]
MKKNLKKIFITLVFILITFSLAALIFFQNLKNFSRTPASSSDSTEIIVLINKGDTFNKTLNKLRKKQLISNSLKFKIFAKLSKKEKKIQSGEYGLNKTMTPEQILNILVSGSVKLRKITIPEGHTISQISDILENKNICSKKEFIKYAFNRNLLKKFNIPGLSFEGYLFPETYLFEKNTHPEVIIKKMIENFFKNYSKEFSKKASELGLSDHEIITLASIIEKETGQKEERTVISSVFHNRLKKNMKLETDPSVIYGIKNFDGNITRADLKKETPYNTYIIKGLPPGPIANPGLKSIKAALYPAKTDFLFFVSKKDGTHYFSKTYSEHKMAVKKYQLGR